MFAATVTAALPLRLVALLLDVVPDHWPKISESTEEEKGWPVS